MPGWRRPPSGFATCSKPAVKEHRDAVGQRHRLLVVLGHIEHRGGSDAAAAAAARAASRSAAWRRRCAADRRAAAPRDRATSARASAVRCFWPLDSSRGTWPSTCSILQQLGDLPRPARLIVASSLRARKRARDVVEGRHMREQREILERHADAALLGRRTDDRAAADADVAARPAPTTPAIRRSSTVLPAPDGPNTTTISPALDRERHAVGSTVLVPKRLADGLESRAAPSLSPSPRRATGPRPDSAGHRARAAASASPRARSRRRSGRIGCRTR